MSLVETNAPASAVVETPVPPVFWIIKENNEIRQLAPGRSIIIGTGITAIQYPYNIVDVWTTEALADLGVYPVFADTPASLVLARFRIGTVDDVRVENNEYRVAYTKIDYTLEEAIITAVSIVNNMAELIFDGGAYYAVKNFHVQIRETDKANLVYLRMLANALIASGSNDMLPFRTKENTVITVTPEEMIEIIDLANSRSFDILTKKWYYVDLIRAAENVDAIRDILAECAISLV